MPDETPQAVQWALQQDGVVDGGEINRPELVDCVRKYFNAHNIKYSTFSASDIDPYLPPELR